MEKDSVADSEDLVVKIKEKVKQLQKARFAIIRSESTFSFMRRGVGVGNKNDNFAKIQAFHDQDKHLKYVVKVTKKRLADVIKLKKDFPNFEEVITNIHKQLILKNLGDNTVYIEPIYVWGEAGIGKTEFIHALCKVLGIGMVNVNAAQLNGALALSGTEPQWGDSAPGMVSQAMMREDDANFIFYLDELDKAFNSTSGGHPLNALYDLLEERTASRFVDQAFTSAVLFDASKIIFMASGNSINTIHEALLSRFNVFKIPMPTIDQTKKIVQTINKSLLSKNDWGYFFEPFLSDEVIDALIQDEQSIRHVKKNLKNAYANAGQQERSYLTVNDMEFTNAKAIPIGFS